MCEMMLEGLKEALTVLIVTHVTHVKRVKRTLTVLIVTHVTHVERVERLHYVHNIDTFNAMSKGSKDYVMLKKRTYTLLLITSLIFNGLSIRKKFWKAET